MIWTFNLLLQVFSISLCPGWSNYEYCLCLQTLRKLVCLFPWKSSFHSLTVLHPVYRLVWELVEDSRGFPWESLKPCLLVAPLSLTLWSEFQPSFSSTLLFVSFPPWDFQSPGFSFLLRISTFFQEEDLSPQGSLLCFLWLVLGVVRPQILDFL